MAAPQTHAWITLGFAWLLKLRGWNFWGAMSFGFFIDILDHFTSWSYVKDVFTRRLSGGDEASEPKKGIKMPKGWVHKWPIIFFLIAIPLFTPVLWYIPLLFYVLHRGLDGFQKYPELSFWYPFRKGEFLPPWDIGYPVKKKPEFIIASTVLAGEALVFYLGWHIY